MKAVIAYLRWWWATRNCQHPRVRRINGDERNHGYGWRCLECGGATNEHTDAANRRNP